MRCLENARLENRTAVVVFFTDSGKHGSERDADQCIGKINFLKSCDLRITYAGDDLLRFYRGEPCGDLHAVPPLIRRRPGSFKCEVRIFRIAIFCVQLFCDLKSFSDRAFGAILIADFHVLLGSIVQRLRLGEQWYPAQRSARGSERILCDIRTSLADFFAISSKASARGEVSWFPPSVDGISSGKDMASAIA